MKIKKKLPAAILVIMLCWSLLGGTAAALVTGTSAAVPQADEDSSSSDTLAGDESASTDAQMDAEQTDSQEYLHEEQFSSDYSMDGLFSQCIDYFNVGDWDIHSANVTLYYTATQLADSTLSSITLTLNDQTFYSERVEPSINGEVQKLAVELPIDAIKKGQNSLTIDAYVRTSASLPCVDDVSKANWMVLSKESSVAIHYYPQIPINTIADCYEQFTSIDALENKQSAVVIRQDASDTELTAAALILSGISGQAQMFYDNIAFETVQDESSLYNGKYRIYVSKYSALLASLKDSMTAEEKQAAQDGAVLVLIKSENGSNVLLLTGSDDDAMLNASRLLGNSSYIMQTRTTWRRVTADEDVLMQKDETDQYLQLTSSGSYVKGAFRQSASFYIEFPENRVLSYSSQISLAMRYSENLDFDRSLVTVYINDEPVGSKKLEKDKAQGDTVVFDIPSDLQVSGNFTVRVSFDLEIKDLWCTLRQEETPWAWVSNESTLKLSSVSADSLIFEYYPSPFIQDGSFDNVVVVLPYSPGDADMEAMRLIMLTFGKFLKDNTGSLKAVHSSDLGDLTSSNVISIGRFEKNPIAQQINNLMFFQFSPEGTTLRSNEKMLIDANYGTILGTVQLLNSPYSEENRALMMVSGVSDNAMLRGVEYIGSTDNLWKIYGDGLVSDGVDVYSYRFKEDNAKEQPGLSQLLTRSDIRGIAITAGLVILLAAIALILLLRKYRKVRQEDEE